MAISWYFSHQYAQLVDRYARQRRRTPEFELQHFFGQLKRLLVLELPTAPQLKLANPTTIILAVIRTVKATLDNNIHYYTEFGIDEVVDLTTVQCVVGRIHDRGRWAIIDRSDNMSIQVTWNSCKSYLSSNPMPVDEFFAQLASLLKLWLVLFFISSRCGLIPYFSQTFSVIFHRFFFF